MLFIIFSGAAMTVLLLTIGRTDSFASAKKASFLKIVFKKNIRLFTQITTGAILLRTGIVGMAHLATKLLNPGEGNFLSHFRSIGIKAGDTVHYLNIAQSWYVPSGEKANEIVFFPLYPILIRAFIAVFRDPFWTGVILSNVLFAVACFFLYKIVRMDYEHETAVMSVLLLSCYPFSAFLSGVYTESTGILLTCLAVYFARLQHWRLASVATLWSGLCRPTGSLVFFLILYEYVFQKRAAHEFPETKDGLKSSGHHWVPEIIVILLSLSGLLIYFAMNKMIQGNGFIFLKHLNAPPWWQHFDWPGNNVADHFRMGIEYQGLSYIIYFVQFFLFFFILGAVVPYGVKAKVRTSYLLYILSYTLLCYLQSWMISGPRYVLSDLPLFVVLAVMARDPLIRMAFLIAFPVLCVLYTSSYLMGHAIM